MNKDDGEETSTRDEWESVGESVGSALGRSWGPLGHYIGSLLGGELGQSLGDIYQKMVDNASGCVTVYDGNDPVGDDRFEKAAKKYAGKKGVYVNSQNLNQAMWVVGLKVLQRGRLFKRMIIFDHGNTGNYSQELGYDMIYPEQTEWY